MNTIMANVPISVILFLALNCDFSVILNFPVYPVFKPFIC